MNTTDWFVFIQQEHYFAPNALPVYYGLLQKEGRLPKMGIDWLIKVLRNGCFHNGPVICPRLSHIGPQKVVFALVVGSGQYNLPWAIMTNLGHITAPL
jgi:hypothetical protein